MLAGEPLVSPGFVRVGNAGNAADPSSGDGLDATLNDKYGSVAYEYQIGTREVTIGQYAAFLNAVAKADPYQLYNPAMATDGRVAGIARSGTSGSYSYTVIGPVGDTGRGSQSAANRPITYVSWFDAARFANWMHNGQPVGIQGSGTTETGAYALNGVVGGVAFSRAAAASFFVPTEDEWYKAAYYDPAKSGYWDYATRSDYLSDNAPLTHTTAPSLYPRANVWWASTGHATTGAADNSAAQNVLTDVGSYGLYPSAYGTYDQTGNVYEWTDVPVGSFSEGRAIRGGSWAGAVFDRPTTDAKDRSFSTTDSETSYIGFRIAAAVPAAIVSTSPAGVAAAAKTSSTDRIDLTFSLPVSKSAALNAAAYALDKIVSGSPGGTSGVPQTVVPSVLEETAAGVTKVRLTATGGPLASGNYRLSVTGAGTAAIRTPDGVPLDGDADGLPGGGWSRSFSIDAAAAIDVTAPVVAVATVTTDDTKPALSGTVDDPAATVLVALGGRTYAAVNAGNGTWALPATAIVDPLLPGVYDVVATATDAFGNAAADPTAGELTIREPEGDTLASAYPASFVANVFERRALIGDGLAGKADVDSFKVRLLANTVLSAEVYAGREPPASRLNAYLRMFDSTGKQLAFDDNSAGSGDPRISGYAITSTGDYFLTVSDDGNKAGVYGYPNDVGTYRLVVTVTPDSAPPTATFGSVASPTPLGIDAVAITFSENVSGLDAADFTLTRNGNAVSLAGAAVTGSGRWYSLANLAGATGPIGDYVLTLRSSGTGIVDESGNVLAAGTAVSWTVSQVASAPRDVRAYVTGTSAYVSWMPPAAEGGAPIASYTLQYRRLGDAVWTSRDVSAATGARIDGLVSNATYEVRVAAVNGFGTGAFAQRNVIVLRWSGVGMPGNAADSRTSRGAVGYPYSIGTFEVTIGQYATFLNAVAASDSLGLFDPSMETNLNVAGIRRTGTVGSYSYDVIANDGDSGSRPVTYVSWDDACRFANWLHNGQPAADAGTVDTTEAGAYSRSGSAWILQAGARYRLPTIDEWYKAAYHSPNAATGYFSYATQSDTKPGNVVDATANRANYKNRYSYSFWGSIRWVTEYSTTQAAYSDTANYLTAVGAFAGSPSYYGTFDQDGNVSELLENQTTAGTSWENESIGYSSASFTLNSPYTGFRLAAPAAYVPEAPSGLTADPGVRRVTLSWTAPAATHGSLIYDYVVEYRNVSQGSGSWVAVSRASSSVTTAVVDGLTEKQSYVFRVRAVSLAGESPVSADTPSVTVRSPLAPTAVTLSGTTVAENKPVGFSVGTLTTADPNDAAGFTYSLVAGAGDADNGSFTIDGNGLLVNALLNYEARSFYTIRVRATDPGNEFIEAPFTILVTDVNEAPAIMASGVVDKLRATSSSALTQVATITVVDDALGTNVVSLTGPDAASFQVSGGALYLKAGERLSASTRPTLSVTVVVTDASLPDAPAANSLTFTVTGNGRPTLDTTVPIGLRIDSANEGVVPSPGRTAGSVLVSTLVAAGLAPNNFSDPDGDLPGVAITGARLGGGRLWFSTNDGGDWTEIGSVSDTSATVLHADAGTRLFFAPAAGFRGTLADLLTIRAWDRAGDHANGATGVNALAMRMDVFDRRVGQLAIGSSRGLVLSRDGRYGFVAAYSAGLTIVDLANPAAPVSVGTYDTAGSALGVTLSADGRYAYVADDSAGLHVIDVGDPTKPVRIGGFDTSGNAVSVVLSPDGRYAYVADWNSGLQVIDVGNPLAPTRVGGFDTSDYAGEIVLSADGRFAYVADSYAGLQIIDVSAPANPTRVSGVDTAGRAWDVALSADGRHVFVADDSNGLQTIDVSVPTAPLLVGGLPMNGAAFGITMSGDGRWAYVTDSSASGLRIVDVRSPASPKLIDSLFAATSTGCVVPSADGRHAYVTTSSGIVVFDTSLPASPASIGSHDTSGSAGGVTLSADGRYAFVADGTAGLQVIDVGTPANPVRVGGYDTSGSGRGVTLSSDGRFVFLADGSAGVALIDVQNRAAPNLTSSLRTSNYQVQTGTGSYWNGWQYVTYPIYSTYFGSTTDVAVSADGRYAYVADYDGGLEVWNVSNPSSPTYLSQIWPSGGTRGAYWSSGKITTVAVSPDARYAYAGSEYGTLYVIDVSNPTAGLTKVGERGSSGYLSDIVISTDGRFAYASESVGGQLLIWNVTNPASPVFVGSAALGSEGAWSVQLSSDGRFAYVAGGSAGLVVLDVSTPASPTVVGRYYDGLRVSGLAVSADGRFAYLGANANGLQVVDMWGPRASFSERSAVVSAAVVTNTAPSGLTLNSMTVVENAPAATIVGGFTTTDADAGDAFTYTLVAGSGDADNAAFEIRNASLVTRAPFDHETKATYSIRVRSTDSGGLGIERAFTVNVADVNEAPVQVTLANAVTSLPENTATDARLKVADIVVTDDALGTNTLSLTGADAADFEVVGAALYLKSGSTVDYESRSSYSLTVQVADASFGGTTPLSVGHVLLVADVNESPIAVILSNTTTRLPENVSTASRIKLANIVVVDDALGTNAVTLAGVDTDAFEIDGTGLYLKAGARLNYKAQPSLVATVRATDATATGGTLAQAGFTLHLDRTAFPNVVVQGSPAALTATWGSPSQPTTMAVIGSGLDGTILATAPAGFEVSSDGTAFGPTATFAPVAGAVSGTLWMRLSAASAVGNYSGNVVLTSAGASDVSVAVATSTVSDEVVFDVASGQTVTHSTSRSGALKYVKRGLGTLVLNVAGGHTGATSVEAGTLVVAAGDALASSAVTVRAGGTLKVNAGVTMRSPSVTLAGGTLDGTGVTILVNASSGIGTFAITSGAVSGSPRLTVSGNGVVTLPTDRRQVVALTALSVDQATGGRLDVGRGRIDVAAGGTTEADLRADVVAGRVTGAFNGTAGIMTSGGKASPGSANPVVGYRVLGTGAAVVAWAAYGDANLDGQVNSTDIALINNGGKFGQGVSTGATWSQGDFNYTGGVNSTDVSLFNNAALYGKGTYLPAAPAGGQATFTTGDTAISQDAWIAYAIDAEIKTTTKKTARVP